MGLSIGETTQGISKSGLEAYRQELHTEAITKTIAKLHDIDDIVKALQNGWQGTAEENFEANFKDKIKEQEEVIQGLKETLDKELDQLEATWAKQDGEMVPRA